MAIEHIMARTWDENILFSVLFELTYVCNLRCFYCYNDLGASGEPLEMDEYDRILHELAEMQVMNLTLSGGEPLAHRHFFDIGRLARELGFVTRIKSNGHALNAEVARRLRTEVDPFVVELSLHGATTQTHDRQTRVKGSFEKLMCNIGDMRDAGLRVKLNCALTRWNEAEVEEIFALAERLGVQIAVNSIVTPRDDGDLAPLDIAATDDGVRRLHEHFARNAAGAAPHTECHETPSVSKNCGAGSSTIAIDPFGEVYPCVQWRRSLGNVRTSTIQEIWNHSSAVEEARRISQAAKTKIDGLGKAGRDTMHCMGLAEELTGDPLGTDPVNSRNAEILRAVNKGE
jgi:MoaA/NifB/PqqE/SkfB family radical SAM enzyme